MSYIEKKFLSKINEIFEDELPQWEGYLLELLEKKSIKIADNVAKVCADFNKNINLILKKYYPEIKEMDDKLIVKSNLKFYYDLIDKLTDFIRNVENFQKIDEKYFLSLIDFIEDKENLITGKYKYICRQELTAFYDEKSRENLEKIIAEKFEKRSREFFTFGSLEEEIKKIARTAGATQFSITSVDNLPDTQIFESAQSLIRFGVPSEDKAKLKEIGEEIKRYLESKGYKVKILEDSVITDLKLLPDKA